MNFLAALDPKDRRLLYICLGIVILLAAITAFLSRNENSDDNTVPSSFLTGKHGARAAYDMLASSGYNLERWEQPLGVLAAQADAQTVVILAEPSSLRLTTSRRFTRSSPAAHVFCSPDSWEASWRQKAMCKLHCSFRRRASSRRRALIH
jgi:hypothetical protein